MKRMTIGAGLALCALLFALCQEGAGSDMVIPASCTVTNCRGDAQSYASGASYYENTSLLFTNCVVYSGGDTSSAIQGLNAVTVQLRIGQIGLNILSTGTVQNATSGTWCATVSIPTNTGGSVFMQLKLIDSFTNSFIYPWKMIRTMVPLQ